MASPGTTSWTSPMRIASAAVKRSAERKYRRACRAPIAATT